MLSHPTHRVPFAGTALFVLLLLFPLLFIAACSSQDPPVYGIGSGGSLGNYYSAARAISRVVNNEEPAHDLRLEHLESMGSVSNIDAILAGRNAFGLVQADREYQAVNGLGDWEERGPQADLRAVFSLYTDAITIVATPASGILSVRDLAGKRIDIGHPDSGTRQIAIDTLDATGTDWKTDVIIFGETPDDRANLYLQGKLDAFFQVVGHPTMDIMFAVNSVPGARFIPLVNSEELLAKRPYYSKAVIPVELYPGVVNQIDVETVGVKVIFLASAKVPDDVVYAVTRAVFENIGSLKKYDPAMIELSKQSMLEGWTAPLHPGAARYYEEAGLL